MNNNDLNRLITALQEKKKYSGFDRFLLFYDDVVFKEIQARKIILSKRFLLDNLTPGAVQYLIESDSLNLQELSEVFKYVEQRLSKNIIVQAFSSVKFFEDSLVKALSHMSQDDVLSIYSSTLLQHRCENLFNNIALKRVNFLHLTNFNVDGIKQLSSLEAAYNLPIFICSNIINSLTLLENEELIQLTSNKKVLAFLRFCASSFINYNTNQDSAFLLGIIDENIWTKITKSDVFAKIVFEIFDVNKIVKASKSHQLYSRWNKAAKKAYEIVPYNELLKIIAHNPFDDIDKMHANKLPISFKDYLYSKMKGYEIFKNENIIQLQADNVDLVSLVFSKVVEESVHGVEFSLSSLDDDLTLSISSAYGRQENLSDVISLPNEQEIDLKSLSPLDKLQLAGWVFFKISEKGISPSHRVNLFSVLSKDLFYSYLDAANDDLKENGKRCVPRIHFNMNSQEIQHYLEIIVSWQENNLDSDLIEWSEVYTDMYALNDLDFKCFHMDLMKRFAVCAVKRMLRSKNGGILSFNLSDHEKSNPEVSDKWLCYSPKSSLLEPLFEEYNLNTSILFSKLAFRAGKESAIEDGVFDQAVLRLSQNNKLYRYSLEKLFPEVNLRDLPMTSSEINVCNENIFTVDLEESTQDYQFTVSGFPIISDLIEAVYEDLSDAAMISIVINARPEYLPEEFLEEFFDRKLYLSSNVFSIFFQMAENIINFRMLDGWRKQAFIDVMKASVDKPQSIEGLSLWDYFFEYAALEDYALKNTSEDLQSYLQTKKMLLCGFLNSQGSGPEDLFRLNAFLWSKEKFKRSVHFLQSPFLLDLIFHHSDIFESNSYDLFKLQMEKTHINMNKSFVEPLFQESLKELPHTPASYEFSQVDLRSKFALWLMSVSPEDIKGLYWPRIIADMPELLYSDIFNAPEFEELISSIPFEGMVALTEKAVTQSNLLGGEFVCREFFKENFQKKLYSEPGKYLEIFRHNPAGFAFLNLLPAMTTQSRSSGWSLALNNTNASFFLTGVKKIITRILDLSNKNNDVVLHNFVDALKNSGSTLSLIKKPLLIFLRDNHLSLYLTVLDAIGDEGTYEDFQLKFNRSLVTQKIELFEEFFLALKKTDDGKQLMVPIDRIYRDRVNCQSYSILYDFLKNAVISEDDLRFLIQKFKVFIERYPTIYFDLSVKSAHPYCENVQSLKNFFVAISDEIFENIAHQRKLNKIIYEQIQNRGDEFDSDQTIAKL